MVNSIVFIHVIIFVSYVLFLHEIKLWTLIWIRITHLICTAMKYIYIFFSLGKSETFNFLNHHELNKNTTEVKLFLKIELTYELYGKKVPFST